MYKTTDFWSLDNATYYVGAAAVALKATSEHTLKDHSRVNDLKRLSRRAFRLEADLEALKKAVLEENI